MAESTTITRRSLLRAVPGIASAIAASTMYPAPLTGAETGGNMNYMITQAASEALSFRSSKPKLSLEALIARQEVLEAERKRLLGIERDLADQLPPVRVEYGKLLGHDEAGNKTHTPLYASNVSELEVLADQQFPEWIFRDDLAERAARRGAWIAKKTAALEDSQKHWQAEMDRLGLDKVCGLAEEALDAADAAAVDLLLYKPRDRSEGARKAAFLAEAGLDAEGMENESRVYLAQMLIERLCIPASAMDAEST